MIGGIVGIETGIILIDADFSGSHHIKRYEAGNPAGR